MSLAITGNTLYLGGGFTSIGGVNREFLAAYDLTNNSLTSFDSAIDSTVRFITYSNNTIYAYGDFTSAGNVECDKFCAIDTINGQVK